MVENVSAPSCRALFLSVLLLGMLVPRIMMGQAAVQGQWSTLPNSVPINPIHVALLRNGKVLIVAGSGNCPPSQSGCPAAAPYGPSNGSGAVLYTPPGTFTPFTVTWDMFCNGMVLLPDGRAFIDGGTIQNGYDPFRGSSKTSIFDPATNTFTDAHNMAHGRWYPTVTTLGDGRVMTFSGLDENNNTNRAVEIYTVGSGWSQEYVANWTPPLYPWMHLLPNGKVFYSGSSASSALFDPSTHAWTLNVATTKYGGRRGYGSSVLLPLTPANNYRPKVMILGGNNPATATTEIIDLGAATPTWQFGPNMSQPRVEMNAVILPNGKVLAMGGSSNDEVLSTSSLNADLYNPATDPPTRSSAGANAFGRLYHSVALLLPDATVWLAGGNPVRGQYEQRMENYKPAYLFQANGTAAVRPSISSVPSSISWGSPFTVQTPDAASIASVVLVRNGVSTHAFDMDQRLVGMSFTAGSGLTVTAPPNGNIAPPGYYMLFILNNLGVPSVARFVQLTQGAQSPDFSLSATPLSRSVAPGGSTTYAVTVAPSGGFNGTVSFSASGLPAGAAASFSGSGPTTMTVTTASSTPLGSYTLTITGTSGSLIRTTTVTLTVGTNLALGKPAVASSLQAAQYPASAAVDGNLTTRWSSQFSDPQWIYVDLGATYNINRVKLVWEAAYGKSFQIQVSPDATNWTEIYSTTTNTALTNDLTGLTGTGRYVRMNGRLRGTPYGYSLYEIEVYGSQAAQSPDFSLSATPSTQSVAAGGSTTYTATVTSSGGFSGTVAFGASGLPAGAAASFNPTTVSRIGIDDDDGDDGGQHAGGEFAGDDHGDKREPESSEYSHAHGDVRGDDRIAEWFVGHALGHAEPDQSGDGGLGALGADDGRQL